ncbi:NADH-quinone oxidoreductase subunit C, partial [Streptomyces erythrochromogenes]
AWALPAPPAFEARGPGRSPGEPGSAGHRAAPGSRVGLHRAVHPARTPAEPNRPPAQPNRIPRTPRTPRTAEETHP